MRVYHYVCFLLVPAEVMVTHPVIAMAMDMAMTTAMEMVMGTETAMATVTAMIVTAMMVDMVATTARDIHG